ncbi:hypothetical protein [Trichocoleus sp. FACHB-46]|uniref:hypothetical protein n=1 Tax=Trichocoleus sp. FACHB-46 TaxID=2692871 RepID=UPI001A7E64F0|nr:hypothetical protein [Trichocoleus sp. FACHB-46]
MNPTFLTIARQGRNGWKRYLLGIVITYSIAITILVPLVLASAYILGIPINNPNASDLVLN